MISSILLMSAVATILTLALRLLRPVLSKRIGASARALAWCVVLAASLMPIRFPLPSVAAPLPTIREAVDDIIASVADPVADTGNTSDAIANTMPGAAPIVVPPVAYDIEATLETTKGATATPADSQAVGTPESTRPTAIDATSAILLIWGIGAAAFMLWGIASYGTMARMLLDTSTPAKDGDYAVLKSLRVKVGLYRTKSITTPMLLGVVVPRVYLPEREYGDDALRSILMHELAHHRRRDIIVKWFALAANAVHWFNPAIYLLRGELARECELAADEAVIRELDKEARLGYGHVLLDVVTKEKVPIGVSSVALCAEARTLKERIEAIAKYKARKWPSLLLSVVLTLALAATVIISTAVRAEASALDGTPLGAAVVCDAPVPTPPEDDAPPPTDDIPTDIPSTAEPPGDPPITQTPPTVVPTRDIPTPTQQLWGDITLTTSETTYLVFANSRPAKEGIKIKDEINLVVSEEVVVRGIALFLGKPVAQSGESIVWGSGDTDVFTVAPVGNGTSARITAVGQGAAKLTVKIGYAGISYWVKVEPAA
uniref:Peptidase M56 domain-containing protein n=1 Tax=uncultured bacterium contig00045 TaxID=1181531 RepID=A0A806JZJ8_9BACT|nr:hypothetical protein [uncultured bacterium contig00045]